ncbi:hypothetical protein OG897_22745 [Streptomyces sp. NBC_00237]|uniref:hypothetical protein n=1 Tax=Streptomyces sp. NBC_00237 TaxID=2975687 RepID=UPI002251D8BB|nr:hypothetical protein [Streptomyces sp. NBC_00237]MCX5204257.1 hypothetical protein [Streptomyces sp. NBC_00237]
MRSTRSARSAAAISGAALCGTLLLAGCGDGKDPLDGKPSKITTPAASATPSGTATPPPSSPSGGPASPSTPLATTDPAPSASVPPKAQRLVAATVSGGIDGRHRSVLVNSDGSYTTLDRKKPPKSGRMGAKELAELRDALADSDFAKLPRVSIADPPIMDGITTAVIYRGHEVATDGMKKIPKLDRVIAALPGLD